MGGASGPEIPKCIGVKRIVAFAMARQLGLTALFAMSVSTAVAEDMLTDRFEDSPETRWRFFTDGVMGGVSTGGAGLLRESDKVFVRLQGQVSTDNNGGFIQIRRELRETVPQDATGVRIVVRGNGEQYYIHLRTRGTRMPWQYYQTPFETDGNWSELHLPFDHFEPSGRWLAERPDPQKLVSLGIVAYGRDHVAELDVREIGFY